MRVVRFLKTYRMYQPGERAGFAKAEAAALIAQGFAVDPDAAPAPQAEAGLEEEPVLTEREQRLVGIIELLDEEDFTQSGKPEVDEINAGLDEGEPPVNAAERDAVWSLMQARAEVDH